MCSKSGPTKAEPCCGSSSNKLQKGLDMNFTNFHELEGELLRKWGQQRCIPPSPKIRVNS